MSASEFESLVAAFLEGNASEAQVARLRVDDLAQAITDAAETRDVERDETVDIAVHDADDDRGENLVLAEFAQIFQRRHQAGHPDGKPGRRNRLTHEARHQAIITTTAADRPEDDFLALLIGHIEGEFRFIDGAGVIFEAAHHGGINENAALIARSGEQFRHIAQFGHALLPPRRGAHGGGEIRGFLQLAPVPEPESWALMLAGLAAVGGLARRRGRSG